MFSSPFCWSRHSNGGGIRGEAKVKGNTKRRLQKWKIKTYHKHKEPISITFFMRKPSVQKVLLLWMLSKIFFHFIRLVPRPSSAGKSRSKLLLPPEESNNVALAQSPVQQNIYEEQELRRDCYKDYCLCVML